MHDYLQGLADHALNVVKAMKADGLEVSILVLNSLINAFGEDRRVVEAFSVLQFMRENVSLVFSHFSYFDLLQTLMLLVNCHSV
jgi:pentatricopeptide repeat protein